MPLNTSGGAATLGNNPSVVNPSPAPTGGATLPGQAPSVSGANPMPSTPDLIQAGINRFGDPTLESLVRQGLDNSPNLRTAVSRIEEGRIRLQVAQSFLLPSVRSSALITTQSLSEHRPIAIPTAADRLPRFQLNTFQLLPIDASYEIDLFRRIRSSIAVASLQIQASETDYRILRLILASDVARFYYLIRGNDTEQAVFQRNIRSRDTTIAIIRERFRAGLINQIDVQRAETDYANLQVQLRGLQRVRTELVNGLAQLCAQDPTTFRLEPGTLPDALPTLSYSSIPADLLRRRPDLQQFEKQTEIAQAQVQVLQATTLPRVTVVGSGGLLSGQIGPWVTPSSATYLVGVNASVPLYEGHRNRQNVALSRQQVQTNQQAYQQALQVAQREAETAVDNLTILRQQIEQQSQALTLARRTEQYNRELYVRGLTTYLEVLDAQRTVLSSELQLVQLRSQEAQYVVALLRSLGGDF